MGDEPSINTAIEIQGWAEWSFTVRNQTQFLDQLSHFSRHFGTPLANRTGDGICDILSPTSSCDALSKSLSRIHSVGEFPLHSDRAHHLTPNRYLILGCYSPGSGGRTTRLLDTQRMKLTKKEVALLQHAPFRIVNGRNSFFGSILAKTRRFIRYDTGCMSPVLEEGEAAIKLFSPERWRHDVIEIQWEIGKILVIDNWRVLHGRGSSIQSDGDRILIRISIG